MRIIDSLPIARNHIRQMKKGDLAFFYHSNCRTPGVAGIMEIVQEHSPDGMCELRRKEMFYSAG